MIAPEDRLTQASESVARRFSRLMNATTSPLGVLTDPPIVGVATAFGVLALAIGLARGVQPTVLLALEVLAILPIVVAVGLSLALARARREVVAWLAELPFPIENLNSLLCGVGDELVVCFEGRLPELSELNAALDAVHPEAFASAIHEETREAVIKVGVIRSKHNPSASNYRRYERFRAIVSEVLVPLAGEREIRRVYVA